MKNVLEKTLGFSEFEKSKISENFFFFLTFESQKISSFFSQISENKEADEPENPHHDGVGHEKKKTTLPKQRVGKDYRTVSVSHRPLAKH